MWGDNSVLNKQLKIVRQRLSLCHITLFKYLLSVNMINIIIVISATILSHTLVKAVSGWKVALMTWKPSRHYRTLPKPAHQWQSLSTLTDSNIIKLYYYCKGKPDILRCHNPFQPGPTWGSNNLRSGLSPIPIPPLVNMKREYAFAFAFGTKNLSTYMKFLSLHCMRRLKNIWHCLLF